jgi:4-carboxymuconolactone decarboxylase
MSKRTGHRASGLLALLLGVTAGAQSPAPAGIHPESLSRVPPLQRETLDADGKRVWDYIVGTTANKTMPRTGPAPVSMYSPKLAEPLHAINQYLRNSVVGPGYFELSALMAAREFDQQYEWSAHEPAAVRAGVEQRVIDVIKFDRDVTGLSDKDATAIRFGRALLRDHKVTPELWARTVEHFGRQGAIEMAAIIGDYVMAGLMLTAVDQQLPPDRKPLLPERRR